MKQYIWIVFLMIIWDTQAVNNIFLPGDCVSCLGNSDKYAGVCQSKYSQFISYCCTPNDMDRQSACYASPMCSQKIGAVDMKGSTCPFHKKKCGGIGSPVIKLKEGQAQTIKMPKSSAFQEADICHYTITTEEQILPRNVDIKKRKYINLWFDYFEGVDVFVSNATSLENVGYRSVVTYTNRNFTQPNTQQYYIVVKPKTGSQWSDYVTSFTAKFYTFDPACPKFTQFNGESCVANYTAYCESLTPLFISQTGDNRTTVIYNGTSCVVLIPDSSKVDCSRNPDNAQCKVIDCKTTPNAPQCQEKIDCVATPDIPECSVKPSVDCKEQPGDPSCAVFERPKISFGLSEIDRKLRQPGKERIAHTVLMIFIVIGLGLYVCINRYKQKQDDQRIDPYDIIQQKEELYKRKLKFNKDNVIGDSSEDEDFPNNASESTIGDKLMVPDMLESPGRSTMRNSPNRRGSGAFPSLGSERSGSAMPAFDMDDDRDDVSSRPGSVYSNYNNMNATSLNAALSHHLHFETASPFTNSRQKKKRGAATNGLFGFKGRKGKESANKESRLDSAMSIMSVKEERNEILTELATRQHGTLIRDEGQRIKEGATELNMDSHPDGDVESARLLASDRMDFTQKYKYTPKDNKLPQVNANKDFNLQQSIVEDVKEDDWELEDAEVVPVIASKKPTNMSISIQEEEKVSEKPSEPVNFHKRGVSNMTLQVDDVDEVEDAISKLEQSKDLNQSTINGSAMGMAAPLISQTADMTKTFNVPSPAKKDMNKTFNVGGNDSVLVNPRAKTNMSENKKIETPGDMSQGHKDESSGPQPKSSNQSEDQSAMLVQGNNGKDIISDSTIKPVEEAPKVMLPNKDMITKAYQAEVQRQMEENKKKLAMFAKKGGKGADDLLKKIQEMKKGKLKAAQSLPEEPAESSKTLKKSFTEDQS